MSTNISTPDQTQHELYTKHEATLKEAIESDPHKEVLCKIS